MRLWWEVARRSFRRHSTYRAATFAGVFTNSFFGFLKTYVLLAVFASRGGVAVDGFDVVDAVTFSWVSQAFYVLVMAAHLDLADLIRTGDVVTQLYLPRDLQAWWLAHDLGRLSFQVLVRGLVPTAVGGLFFHLRLPGEAATLSAFAAAVVLAAVVCFAHRFIVTMLTFWMLDYRGTAQVATVLILFFSGMLVPIDLFPSWLETLARFTPYPAMLQVPIEVLLGKHAGWQAVSALAGQALWAVVLLGAGRVLLAAATRKVVVQGG